MKLSADILYWQLKKQLSTVTLQGQCGSALTLTRPEFYLDRSQSFEKDRVYVCSADHLPQRPSLGENVCLVCLGQHWNLTAYYHRCSVILVERDWDIFRTFNLVQHIFDQYDSWEERLWTILRHGAVLQQMLDASRDIFENPLLLTGSDFRYLGVTQERYLQNELGLQLDTQAFDAEKMATFLSLHDMSTHIREPLLLELQGKRTLSVNIFDQEEYLGCLTVFEGSRPLRDSDKALAVFLVKLLRQAVQQNPVLASTRTAVRRALRSVIAGQSVDFEHRQAISLESGKNDWVCVKLIPKPGRAALPGAYLSAALEERHPGAMAFEYEHSVAGFLPAGATGASPTDALSPILEKLGVACGISSVFSSLYDAGHAWFQASSALQNGMLRGGISSVFFFQDYLLPQLLSGALAGRPGWVFYTEGLKRLKEHDSGSQVSYLHTLRVYLDNNLSVTKTAAALYLHRSTLLDRLTHITAMLGSDLKNPDDRLTLGIILRSELEQQYLEQSSAASPLPHQKSLAQS